MTTQSLSANLNSKLATLDFSSLDESVLAIQDKFDKISKTILGNELNEIKGGVQALTKEIDITTQGLKSNLVPTITKLTKDVNGIKNDLVTQVNEGLKSDLSALTSSVNSTNSGFLKDIISGGSPEAISASIEKSIGKSAQDIKDTLKTISGSISEVSSLLNFDADTGLLSELNKLQSSLNDIIQIKTDFVMIDFGEEIEKRYENTVQSLVDVALTKSEIAQTMKDLSNGNLTKAFGPISDKISKPDNYDSIVSSQPQSKWSPEILETYQRISEQQSIFDKIRVEVSEYNTDYSSTNSSVGTNSLVVKETGNLNTYVKGASSVSVSGQKWVFEPFQSIDELEAEFRNISRSSGKEVAGCTVHWSATFLDQNVDATWVDKIHKKELNAQGCGYHILILRDGTLQRGRPMNLNGAHDLNHNTHFLGFCFIGGINQYSKNAKKPYWKYSSANSFTPQQFKAYENLMATFHDVFPYAQVCGHYMTSNSGKMDPGFDVIEYSKAKFGHYNVFSEHDPIWKQSNKITVTTINEAIA